MQRLRRWARALYAELATVALLVRDPAAPRLARVVALLVIAYAASPIDLVPDVIPVLGYVDDLLIVPLGIMLVRALVPRSVYVACRERAIARATDAGGPARLGAALVVAAWLLAALASAWLLRIGIG